MLVGFHLILLSPLPDTRITRGNFESSSSVSSAWGRQRQRHGTFLHIWHGHGMFETLDAGCAGGLEVNVLTGRRMAPGFAEHGEELDAGGPGAAEADVLGTCSSLG